MPNDIALVGLDIAKSVFQVHGAAADGRAVLRRRLRREEVEPFFRGLPPCRVGLEACPGSHHWGRLLRGMGHDVRLLPAQYVRPYVKTNKNDAADAEAICEAMTRPTMRFVPIKEAVQQEVLVVHRVREMLMRQRTQLINGIRGHLAEFGLVGPERAHRIGILTAIIEDETDSRVPVVARKELGLARETARPTVSERRGGGDRQQDGAHHLGDAAPWRGLRRAGAAHGLIPA